MSGRGRGRGGGRGGANKSFNKEQLSALGVGATEVAPGPVTQPPALYPPLERKPVLLVVCINHIFLYQQIKLILQPSIELDYLLLLRQEFIEHMQLSPAYLKMRDDRKQSDKAIDKLVAQLPSAKEKFDWKLLPNELRPKLIANKLKKNVEKAVDVNQRYDNNNKIMIDLVVLLKKFDDAG